MRSWVALLAVCMCSARGGGGPTAVGRHAFYRSLRESGARPGSVTPGSVAPDTRRVFGGEPAALSVFPAACALLDRYWRARCSAAVLAPRWVLTAAHCVTPRLAYVKYNSVRPTAPDGDVAPVHYLYRHPKYQVVQEDEGRGMDVTRLQHDVGLVCTRVAMTLSAPGHAHAHASALRAIARYDLRRLLLHEAEVQVLGFGRTEQLKIGEQLYSVQLRLVACERSAWQPCVCAVSPPSPRAADHAATATTPTGERGVCAGDSGGPVLYKGVQVGITSMGPVECAQWSADSVLGATSVLTSLREYADLINATIHESEAALRMRQLSADAQPAPSSKTLCFTLLLLQFIFDTNIHSCI